MKLTVSIDKAAYDLLIYRYVGARGLGEFIANLIYAYDAKADTREELSHLAAELKTLADRLAVIEHNAAEQHETEHPAA